MWSLPEYLYVDDRNFLNDAFTDAEGKATKVLLKRRGKEGDSAAQCTC